MTKLTEMINLKAAVTGAAVLTALSSFVASPVQAIIIGGGPSTPNEFTYQFLLDTGADDASDSSGDMSSTFTFTEFTDAVEDLKIFDDTNNELLIGKSDLPNLNLKVQQVKLSEVPGDITFEAIFSSLNGFNTTSTQGFKYTVDFTSEMNPEGITVSTSSGDVTFETAGFVVPINPEFFPSFPSSPNPLKSLEDLINLDVEFPIFAEYSGDEDSIVEDRQGLGDDGQGISFSLVNQPESVPEASTPVSILALGILGIGAILKRKQQNKPLN